jgi:hypothetical protein
MIDRHIYALLTLLLLQNKQSSSFSFTTSHPKHKWSLYAITKRVTAVWDGSELQSLEQYFQTEINPLPFPSPFHDKSPITGRSFNNSQRNRIGFSIVVAGTMVGTNERIVGILKHNHPNIHTINSQEDPRQEWVPIDHDSFIYHDSMATIPPGVTDDEAIQTLVASLVGVHCAFHPTVLTNVGGSLDHHIALNLVGKSAVILGGGDTASFISSALSVLGAKVFQITNAKIGTRPRAPSVIVQDPVQRMGGGVEVGFSESVGSFHVLVDCMSDESNTMEGRGVILRELERRHGCQR